MSSDVCRICGKTLENEESIEAGIGPVCSHKLEKLAMSQERMAQATLDKLPDGYVPLKDAITVCHEHGIPVGRLVKAIGGDKLYDEPIGKEFWPVYYRGRRYLPEAVLKAIPDNLKMLDEVEPEPEPKPKRTRKPKAQPEQSALDRVIAAKEQREVSKKNAKAKSN